jgi:hypothetical protein
VSGSLTLASAGEPLRIREFGQQVLLSRERIDVVALQRASARWKGALGLPSEPFTVEEAGADLLVSSRHVTGVVRVADLDIEVRPKFLGGSHASWQTALWRILAAVDGGLIDDNQTSATHTDDEGIADLLAQVFIASWGKGSARGLPRQYRTSASVGSRVHGALDTTRLGEWIAKPWAVPYLSDELTDDTPLARLLRWAADQLAVNVHTPGRRRSLREVSGMLHHAGRLVPSLGDARRIHLGAQHQALKPALDMALLLLEGRGIHHAAGEFEIPGFLWRSDKVYERFVYWLAQRAARRCGYSVSKQAISFGEVVRGEGARLATTPDVVFRHRDRTPAAVLDAKYKNYGARPKSDDTYQILTGGHVLGSPRVALTYPTDTGASVTTWRVTSGLGGQPIALSAIPLDLLRMVEKDGATLLVDKLCEWLTGDIFPVGALTQ